MDNVRSISYRPFPATAVRRSLDWLQDNISSLTKLDNAACIKAYGTDYVSSYGDLLLVSSPKNATNSVLSWDSIWPPDIGSGSVRWNTYDWICLDSGGDGYDPPCEPDEAIAKAGEWTLGGQPINYCLSRKNEEHCRLQFSLVIMIFVILCNLVKTICMMVIVWKEKAATLVTLGDAISSFLQNPDSITAGCFLAGKDDFQTGNSHLLTIEDKKYLPKRYRWFRAASLTRWAAFHMLCLITLITASILLRLGLSNYLLRIQSFSHLRQLGFGVVTAESLISGMDRLGFDELLATVFVINLSQIILSFLYLIYNGLFTCMLMAFEWSGFAHERKYLRVTSPVEKPTLIVSFTTTLCW